MNFKIITILLLCSSASLLAQTAAGVAGISGTLHDPSGSPVPNAKVTISSESQGEIRSLTSNDAGVFSAPALVPGSGYHVTVTASGFANWEVKDMDVPVGRNVNLDVKLQIATANNSVEVTAAVPLVDDTKSDVSTVVTAQQIQ